MSTELEARRSAVPALSYDPASQIDGGDVSLPRLYIGQFMSSAVQEELVKPGSIYAALSADDANPAVLWEPKKQGANPGPVFHVLGLRKGRSLSVDGELETWAFDDPDAPAEAWITYTYFIALPEVDQDVPHRWLLTRTGKPTAQQINTVLMRNAAAGPSHIHAFQVTTAPRENAKGKYFVPQLTTVEAKPENIEVAAKLSAMVSGQSAEANATGDEPAI